MNRYFLILILFLFQFQNFSQDSLSNSNDPSIVYLFDKPPFNINKWYTELNDSIMDIDSNYYHKIKLGSQIWLKENLKVSKYNNGQKIQLLQDSSDWINAKLDGYTKLYKESSSPRYFYNYKVVSNHLNICPCGWKIPDSLDLKTLKDYAELVNNDILKGNGTLIFIENDTVHLRAERIDVWNSNIEGLSFSNQAFGYRSGINGKFVNFGDFGYWWTTSDSQIAKAWSRIFIRGFGIDDIHLSEFSYHTIDYGFVKNHGLSIRCVQE